MSKIAKQVNTMRENMNMQKSLHTDEVVVNFMGGDSYKLNPIDTLKMIAASSIFGEASYYRKDVNDGTFTFYSKFSDTFAAELFSGMDGKTTTEIFQDAIDAALTYDFGATLDLAVTLRTVYNMRLNPQVIMVRASVHPNRAEFTKKFPGRFAHINNLVMSRADECATQATYFMYMNNGKKNNMPSVLKRSIAGKLESLSAYQVNKYKNHEIGMIDTVRLVHAHSAVLDELMKNGTVTVDESEKTWEQKRSAGMGWREIISTTNMGHMALLRNIRNVFTDIDDLEFCKEYMQKVKDGVLTGKQFPFRYESAYKAVENSEINHKQFIMDALEECIDISIDNMPKLKGKTACLSDNSGSAWGVLTSEYGTTVVAHIDNLSSVIAAQCSDEGKVFKFGDELVEFNISKHNGVLKQALEIDDGGSRNVGGSTEGGIWKFFRDAIKNKTHYDNIFIFSDQQAGTGGLYGTDSDVNEYEAMYGIDGDYEIMVNVYKLILDYRKAVNPKVNVFSVQTAGYNNVLIPAMSYRTAMLTGWTGKEIQFAAEYIRQWDEIERKNGH